MRFKPLFITVFVLITSTLFIACSSDDVEPEILPQDGKVNYFNKAIDFTSDGGSVAVCFSTNVDWTIVASSTQGGTSWCNVSQSSGKAGTFSILITANPNTDYDDRNVVLTLTADKVVKTIIVNQKQKDIIIIDKNSFVVTMDSFSFDVEVKANVEYVVEIPTDYQSWISKSKSTRGLTTKKVSFTIAKNEEYNGREGEVYFKYGDIKKTLKISQNGGAIIVCLQSDYYLEGNETTIEVQLESNIDYSVSSSDEWISEISTRALSSSKRYFKVAINKTGKSRTGKITFTTSDGTKTATANITQATIVKATSLDISFYGTLYAYIGETYNFFVTCTPSNAVTDYEWSSSNTNVLSVSGIGSNAKVKIVGYGEANVIAKEKNSGKTKEFSIHSRVSGFSWNSTGETYSGNWPLTTIKIGESEKLSYSSNQGSSIPDLFGNLGDFVFYEPNYVVSKPSVVSIDADGTITGLKVGTIGIKPSGGYIFCSSNGNVRIYIKVVSEYVESEYNNEFSNANIIKNGQAMKFSLSSSSDIDVFKFKVTSSPYMTINLEYLGENSASANDRRMIRYEVYDSNYQLGGSGTLDFNAKGEAYQPMSRYVGYGSYAYLRLSYPSNYGNAMFPNGFFKASVEPDNQ